MVSNQGEQVLSDTFQEVELTEEEKELALLNARRDKFYHNKLVEYKNKIQKKAQFQTYTPTELYEGIRDAGFIMDEFNKQIFWNLCRYFAGDPRGPYNLRKGLLLYGPVGCYKTSIMKYFAANQSNSFAIYSVSEIASEFQRTGHDSILRYKTHVNSTDTYRTFGQKELGICFDDFGTENTDSKFFGNEANVMTEIIMSRFMSHENLIAKTHFTTNINMKVIEERYGYRVRSRLREMVTLVEFPDDTPDRRK